MIKPLNYKTTAEIQVPKKLVEQVIGQEESINIIKKAALQRRHVLLIGEPGTGKSMIGQALAELLPKEKLSDILVFPNEQDENVPLIRAFPKGQGKKIITKLRLQSLSSFKNQTIFMLIIILIITLFPYYLWKTKQISDIIYAASMITSMIFLVGFIIFLNIGRRIKSQEIKIPKLLIDNSQNNQAPFLDGTGTHAGALLGDILHDPLQCFLGKQKLKIKEGSLIKNKEIKETVDTILNKSKNIITKKEKNYEASFLQKNQLHTFGEIKGFISPVEILSSNRHDYDGEMIKITTSENKELIVTPNHKVAILENGKINYIEARNLKEGWETIVEKDEIIIDEEDIINTFNKRQQELVKSYYNCLELREKNTTWGYKRIATKLGVSYGRTRGWWKNSLPVPIQTVEFLKDKGLIPLKVNNPNLPLIAKITGATFGDGGIFENLNGIFLSSSELESTKEFGKDLIKIFGKEIHKNSRTIEGGIEGHSWCYQNTNRKIIRFFKALGAPIGNKTKINLDVPSWIYLSKSLEDEFFGSLMGGELGVPKIHKQKNRLNTLDLGIGGKQKFIKNRKQFLNKLKEYLESKGVNSTSINQSKIKSRKKTIIFRLMISIQFDNVIRFIKNTKINYCVYKKEKIINTINEFRQLKKEKYNQLIKRGYGAEHVMKLLNITPKSLYIILNEGRIL